jgi:putative transposase
MYSREKRLKAIKLYIKYGRSAAAVIHELGYPSRKLLPRWYAEYLKEQETGVVRDQYSRSPKYSTEQKKAAVTHFLEHGRNIARTARVLGYPCRETLSAWCKELLPDTRKKRVGNVQYTKVQKLASIIVLETRVGSAKEVAQDCGVTRAALYKWKNDLLGKEGANTLTKLKARKLPDDKDALIGEIELLKKQIYQLQLEKTVLEATAEILKKDPGVDQTKLTNQEKTLLIGTLKNKYPLKVLLEHVGLARSSYFYHRKIATLPDKYETLRDQIIRLFTENNQCYGYRRIYGALGQSGIRVSEKVVQQIMTQQQLVVIGKRKRKYSSYQGEVTPAVPNLIARDFHADAPNIKWLTDLTEFHIPAGKVYLSPMVDCFDGLLTSSSIGISPDAELVNSMLDVAISTLNKGEQPIVHSDRGAHYRWPGWLERMKEAGLTRSMSQKGCSPDNAACEGFFGRIKNEMFYNRSWAGVSIEEFINVLDEYLHWYNEKRIKMSLGAMSPLEYRRNLGLAA